MSGRRMAAWRERRSRRRLAIAVGLLAAWGIMLFWHVRREYFKPFNVRLAEASANLTPAAANYSVKLGDRTIGFASSQLDTLPDGFLLQDRMNLRLRALGVEQPTRVRTRIRMGERLELQSFEFALSSNFGDYTVTGGMQDDSVLVVDIKAGSDDQRLDVPTDGPILLPEVMPLHFALGGEPKKGEEITFEVFDPGTLERQRITMEVVGREMVIVPDSAIYDEDAGEWVPATYDTVPSWHVIQRFGGVEIESWLDPSGHVVRATSPLGYTIERTAWEIAWYAYRERAESEPAAAAAGTPDIVERTAISVGTDLPTDARLQGLTVRLRNVDLEGFDLDGASQALHGDTLSVRRAADLDEPGYQLPADAVDWDATLVSTPLVQSDDPAIRRAANDAIGDTRDPVEAARRLTEWVYGNLDKEITLSVPSARQVLERRQGDCNEHTVLYVALARAVGLPARTAAGLVYVGDRFYYHAWPEVWLGAWVPVDPTLDQFPADASHLRFVIGGLARQVELVRLIGLLELDVLSVEAL